MPQTTSAVCFLIFFGISVHGISKANATDPEVAKFPARVTRDVAGWSLQIESSLLEDIKDKTELAVKLLEVQLKGIQENVPESAVKELQKVPLFFSRTYSNSIPKAEYHPSEQWLQENDRDPQLAKSVEFSNIQIFEEETIRMPNFALHELAHAYHDRFLENGFENDEVKVAFERAKAAGAYSKVERFNGAGRPNSFEPAYALTNPMEYFAETSEAYFFRNDFFPFDRAELEAHDPRMLQLLQKLWEVPQAASH